MLAHSLCTDCAQPILKTWRKLSIVCPNRCLFRSLKIGPCLSSGKYASEEASIVGNRLYTSACTISCAIVCAKTCRQQARASERTDREVRVPKLEDSKCMSMVAKQGITSFELHANAP